MSVEVLDTLKQQAKVLSAKEKFVLANYLLAQAEQDKKTESQNGTIMDEDVRRRRMEWLKANRENYGGQYVILDGNKLLGVAKNYPEGKQIAVKAGVPDAFVDYLSKPDEEGFIGGW